MSLVRLVLVCVLACGLTDSVVSIAASVFLTGSLSQPHLLSNLTPDHPSGCDAIQSVTKAMNCCCLCCWQFDLDGMWTSPQTLLGTRQCHMRDHSFAGADLCCSRPVCMLLRVVMCL